MRTALIALALSLACTSGQAEQPKENTTLLRAAAYILGEIDIDQIGREDKDILGSSDGRVVIYSVPNRPCVFQLRTTRPPYYAAQINFERISRDYLQRSARNFTFKGSNGAYCEAELTEALAREMPTQFDENICSMFSFEPTSNYQKTRVFDLLIAVKAKACPKTIDR